MFANLARAHWGERRASTAVNAIARSERSAWRARWFAKSIVTLLRDRVSLEERIVGKLLDSDFWITLGSKLLDTDFWVTMWTKLLGAELWRTVWRAFSSRSRYSADPPSSHRALY